MKIKIINWEIYHKNFIKLAEAIMYSGGNPFFVLGENEDFLITLANNHIELGCVVKHNPDLSENKETFQELEPYQEKFKQ